MLVFKPFDNNTGNQFGIRSSPILGSMAGIFSHNFFRNIPSHDWYDFRDISKIMLLTWNFWISVLRNFSSILCSKKVYISRVMNNLCFQHLRIYFILSRNTTNRAQYLWSYLFNGYITYDNLHTIILYDRESYWLYSFVAHNLMSFANHGECIRKIYLFSFSATP